VWVGVNVVDGDGSAVGNPGVADDSLDDGAREGVARDAESSPPPHPAAAADSRRRRTASNRRPCPP